MLWVSSKVKGTWKLLEYDKKAIKVIHRKWNTGICRKGNLVSGSWSVLAPSSFMLFCFLRCLFVSAFFSMQNLPCTVRALNLYFVKKKIVPSSYPLQASDKGSGVLQWNNHKKIHYTRFTDDKKFSNSGTMVSRRCWKYFVQDFLCRIWYLLNDYNENTGF